MNEFRITGTDGRMVLGFRPRRMSGADDVTVMSVFHRAIGGDVAVPLSTAEVIRLADWFGSQEADLQIADDRKVRAWLRRHPSGYAVVTCYGVEFGQSRSTALSAEDARAVHGWLARLVREGWKRGAVV